MEISLFEMIAILVYVLFCNAHESDQEVCDEWDEMWQINRKGYREYHKINS